MNSRIMSVDVGKRKILISEPIDNNENIFTILTGPNGTGKSLILNKIIEQFLDDTGEVDCCSFTNKPNKLIAISSGRYHKFPDTDKTNIVKNYVNLSSLEQDPNEIAGMGMSVVLSGITTDKRIGAIFGQFLNWLGFSSSLNMAFSYNKTKLLGFLPLPHDKAVDEFILNETISHNDRLKKILPEFLHPKQLSQIYVENISEIIEFSASKQCIDLKEQCVALGVDLTRVIIDTYNKYSDYIECVYSFDDLNKTSILLSYRNNENEFVEENIFGSDTNYSSVENIALLIRLGILTVGAVEINKPYSKYNIYDEIRKVYSFKLGDLSSGQISIMSLMMGIIGSIENNTTICIDEPELALHPEWQEKFIKFLQDLCVTYSGCHFVIATHSPQITSGLNCENGFVVCLDNDSQILYHSKDFAKKSIDFQLATLFGCPGTRNEYLIKISVVLLGKVAREENLEDDDIKLLDFLISIQSKLEDQDVAYLLIEQLLGMVKKHE